MFANVDPDAILELLGFVVKISIVLVVLSLPAQGLLVLARRFEQRRRVIAVSGAVIVVLVAALATDVVFYSYDGSVSHTLVLLVMLVVFSLPAQLLLFFAVFGSARILPRLAALAGSAMLIIVGAAVFGVRAIAYGLQHSLGGWP